MPTARVNDGFFDVVITRPIPAAIGILMAIYVPGWYAHTPFVQRLRCKSLRLICPGMTVNLDGELIDCDDADFELLASALPVRIPAFRRAVDPKTENASRRRDDRQTGRFLFWGSYFSNSYALRPRWLETAMMIAITA